MTPPAVVKPRRRGPESEFWDRLKGKRVVVLRVDGTKVRGTLLWVDLYTVGVNVEKTVPVGPQPPPQERMLFKQTFADVSLDDVERVNEQPKR